MSLSFAAIILAGGRGARLGYVDKPLVLVRGRTMLEAALAATHAATRAVVVGQVPVPPGVLQVVEDPPFGGPAAGLAAGLTVLEGTSTSGGTRAPEPWVLVLASDLPRVDAAVPTLLAAAEELPAEVDGVCFHDDTGHPQWMLALYRTGALRRAVAAVETTDCSLRRLLAPLTLTTIPGEAEAITDCDTWDDVRRARRG